MTFSPAASIFPFGKDGNTMTERAKKTLATIGMELGFLLLKLFALATLIVPLALFLFVATWEGGQIGYFVAFFTVVAYFSLALLLIVWWPFHKYAYSKLSRRGKGRLWSFVAVMLAATSFMLFTYRAVDERTFPAGMETFRVVVRDPRHPSHPLTLITPSNDFTRQIIQICHNLFAGQDRHLV